SRIILDILARYGYTKKDDNVYIECFDLAEIRRLREELKCSLKLIQLIPENGIDSAGFRASSGVKKKRPYADGIWPGPSQVVGGRKANGELEFTPLVEEAHRNGLLVHPYTLRADLLPTYAGNFDELLETFLARAGVDGVFTDFPDRAVAFREKRRDLTK